MGTELLERRRHLMFSNGQYLPIGFSKIDKVKTTNSIIDFGKVGFKGTEWIIEAQKETLSTSNEILIAHGSAGGYFFGALSNGKWGMGTGSSSYYVNSNVNNKTRIIVKFLSDGLFCQVGDETAFRNYGVSRFDSGLTLLNSKAVEIEAFFFKGYIYEIECTKGMLFKAIPVERNSDSIKGLYDLANHVFYPIS